MKLMAFLLLFVTLILPQTASAWSDDGHELVAQIAYDRLSPDQQQKLEGIVGGLNSGETPYNSVTAACWPDDIKNHRPATRKWHYIDLPLPSGPVPPIPHVVWAITQQIQQFQAAQAGPDTADNRQKKAETIAFIIHFVGDIHQSLHCAENNQDGGGNAVVIANAAKGTNLHHVWDGAYSVHMATSGGNVVVPGNSARPGSADDVAFQQRAQELVRQFPPGLNWNHLGQDYMAWARETHGKAVTYAYHPLQPDGRDSNPATLTSSYVSKARSLAGKRVVLAGYRLAVLLQQLL